MHNPNLTLQYVEVICFESGPRESDLPSLLSSFLGIPVTLGGAEVGSKCPTDQAMEFGMLGRNLSSGERGCANSHIASAGRAVAKQAKWSLIVEDDVQAIADLALIETYLSRLSLSVPTVLHLGTVQSSPINRRLTHREGKLRRERLPSTGTYAYCLNLAAAEILASLPKNSGAPADWPPDFYTPQVHFFKPTTPVFRHVGKPMTDRIENESNEVGYSLINSLLRFKSLVLHCHLNFPTAFKIVFLRPLKHFLVRDSSTRDTSTFD